MKPYSIFVSIASYRDSFCKKTIQHLFEQAKLPSRIFVGICQQNNLTEKEEDCMSDFLLPWKKQIRVYTMDYKEAKGPTYARYICATQLYEKEDFFLQIDSHNKFVKHWDTTCVEMFLTTQHFYQDKRVILSYYPADIADFEDIPNNKQIPVIKSASVNENNITKWNASIFEKASIVPQKTFFIAAGFLFTSKLWLQEVPFDPYLDYLFVGEELLLSARSFTSNWNVYTPNKNILYHYYYRKKEHKIWKDLTYSAEKAKKRLFHILNNKEKEYGLGNERCIHDFFHSILPKNSNKTTEFFSPMTKNKKIKKNLNLEILLCFTFILLLLILFQIYIEHNRI